MNPARPDDQPRHQRWFCSGLILGLLVSSLLTWRWIEAGAGTTVSVLGSGKYVSVLITNDQRRVLFASGSDGPAFSNAVGKALPPIAGSIDILLIDPRASADVFERAQSLSPKRVIRLPDQENANEAGSVQQSFILDLGDGVAISVHVSPERSWVAAVDTGAGRITINPEAGHAVASTIQISLDGSFPTSRSGHAGVQVGPTTKNLAPDQSRAVVSSGAVLSIAVDGANFRLPGDSLTRGWR